MSAVRPDVPAGDEPSILLRKVGRDGDALMSDTRHERRRTSPRLHLSAGHLGTVPGRPEATSAVTEPSGLARRSYGQASLPPFHAVPVRALRPVRIVIYRSARNGR